MPEFTKKYWQAHRHKSAKASGVGEALEQWQKDCKGPDTFKTYAQFEAALKTVHLLTTALGKAKQKTSDKDTLKLIGDYEKDAERYRMNVGSEYHDRVAAFTASRKAFYDMAHDKAEKFKGWVAEAHSCLERVNHYEDTAADANETARGLIWKHVHEMIQAMAIYSKNMETLESNTAGPMTQLKGDNPGQHGVLEKDAKEGEAFLLKTTDLSNLCSSNKKQMRQIQLDFKDAAEATLATISGQRKDLSESLGAAQKLLQGATAETGLLEDAIGSGERTNITMLRNLDKPASLTQLQKDQARNALQDMQNRKEQMPNRQAKIAGFMKNFMRVSRPHQADPGMQDISKKMAVVQQRVNTAMAHFQQLLTEADTLGRSISTKPIAATAH